jgi:hypothetical protein
LFLCSINYLNGQTVGIDKARPQRLMASDNFVQAAFKRRRAKISGQPQIHWAVVRALAGIELFQEPQSLLRK